MCFTVMALWRMGRLATVDHDQLNLNAGVELLDLMQTHAIDFQDRQIDQIGLILEQPYTDLFGFVQQGLVPVDVWKDRVDMEFVLVIGYQGTRHYKLTPHDHWQVAWQIASDMKVFHRKSEP